MKSIKKILVPTDFSACAQNAVDVSIELAVRANAHIVFQHLIADRYGNLHVPKQDREADGREVADPMIGKARSKLDELVAAAARLGISAQSLLVINKGNDRIENYIKPLDIDLVVMGSHGASGIREWIIGSVTQRVVRHAEAPVLVVKHRPEKIKFDSILFASTFHDDPFDALTIPVAITTLWKGTIHLLYIGLEKDHQSKADIEQKMELVEKQFPQTSFTRNFITTNDPSWGIKHPASTINPDSIALTTRLKTGAFIFSHSVAETLVNHESLPVLVMNASD